MAIIVLLQASSAWGNEKKEIDQIGTEKKVALNGAYISFNINCINM